jgi:hypothetical protein
MENSLSLEHIDPLRHHLICGLKNDHNEIVADLNYNKSKNNRFVPYRVLTLPPPVTFGDMGEFLIKGQWVVCEFGGEAWKKECRRVGFNSTVTGSRVGSQHKLNGVGLFDKEHETKVQVGRRKGCINAAKIRRRRVKITTPQGEVVTFNSCTEAGRYFNLNLGELSKCCHGHIQTVKGHRAEFTDTSST